MNIVQNSKFNSTNSNEASIIQLDRSDPISKAKKDNWGIRLTRVLKEKNLTGRKAATVAGVAPSVILSWQNGSSPTDLQAVKRLSDFLGVSFTWLLTGEQELGKKTSLIEMFDEVPYFDGVARIRIDRLVPKEKE